MKEIVIKIPDEVKEMIDNYKDIELIDMSYLIYAVRNGKVLPKGHGELKDSQKIVNNIANTNFWLSADNWNELMKAIRDVDALVEADKGDTE